MRYLLAAALLLVVGVRAWADPPTGLPFLNPLFSDNMVLQRGLSDPVWGWAPPGSLVTVTIDGYRASGYANPDSSWRVKLPPLPEGGPYTMTVSGPKTVVLQNVDVGDVWVCAGQSNMEFGIGNALNASQEIAAANYPQIRLFTVLRTTSLSPLEVTYGNWTPCAPDTILNQGTWNGFSAVSYFFGRDLYENLNIPIGLIQAAWGASTAEAWVGERDLIQTLPEYMPAGDILAAARGDDENGRPFSLSDAIDDWYAKNDPGSSATPAWQDPSFDDSAWKIMQLPQYFQFSGDPDLASFHGIVWFRRTVDIPAGLAGQDAVLHLYADDNDTTWVNGVKVGYTEGYQNDRRYTVTGRVLHQGTNTIAVRVLDTGGLGGIYGTPDQLALDFSGDQSIDLAGPWRYRAGTPLSELPLPPTDPNQIDFPSVVYNGMVAPIAGFGIKGVVWDQGENNVVRAYQYRTLLPTLIADWRRHWGEGNFPFYIVQLAVWHDHPTQPGDDDWAELREAQYLTSVHTPNSGLAVTIDIGDPNDLHYANKQEVGRRLSLIALAKTYGRKVEYSGPVYKSMKIEGSSIRLSFTHADGLTTQDGQSLTGFAIAGADHKFVWADATIDGATVIVSSPAVPNPVAVRYAWSINPICNLSNQSNLPAVPFRTDDWPGITYGVK